MSFSQLVEVTDSDEHTSLLRYGINYDRKKFHAKYPELERKGTNVLAYCASSSSTKKKSFPTLTPELPSSVTQAGPQHPRVAETARRGQGRPGLVHVQFVGQPPTKHSFRCRCYKPFLFFSFLLLSISKSLSLSPSVYLAMKHL